jgi:hypothetical protein
MVRAPEKHEKISPPARSRCPFEDDNLVKPWLFGNWWKVDRFKMMESISSSSG